MARLEGRRLLLTRSAEDSADWAEALAAEGAVPIVLPCIRSESLIDPMLAIKVAAGLVRADWLVFTSKRGISALADAIGTAVPLATRIAAVGDATAAAASETFGRVDCVGTGTAADLGRELAERVEDGDHCVLVLAENADAALERALADAGATIERFDVYRTLPAGPVEPKRALSSLGCDTVIFASPSAVAGFANQVNVDKTRQMVTIGPSTSAAVRERRWEVAAEAREPSLSGIIESVVETTHA
jgi:uroporphyrinogen-III synthase